MKRLYFILFATCAAILFVGCHEATSPAGTNAISNTNPADINNPLMNAKRTADKTIDFSYLNQAIQLFNVQEGRYPKTLDELTPKYVSQLPVLPPGYKLNYDAVKGDVTLVRE